MLSTTSLTASPARSAQRGSHRTLSTVSLLPCLVVIAIVMLVGHNTAAPGASLLAGSPRMVAGMIAGPLSRQALDDLACQV